MRISTRSREWQCGHVISGLPLAVIALPRQCRYRHDRSTRLSTDPIAQIGYRTSWVPDRRLVERWTTVGESRRDDDGHVEDDGGETTCARRAGVVLLAACSSPTGPTCGRRPPRPPPSPPLDRPVDRRSRRPSTTTSTTEAPAGGGGRELGRRPGRPGAAGRAGLRRRHARRAVRRPHQLRHHGLPEDGGPRAARATSTTGSRPPCAAASPPGPMVPGGPVDQGGDRPQPPGAHPLERRGPHPHPAHLQRQRRGVLRRRGVRHRGDPARLVPDRAQGGGPRGGAPGRAVVADVLQRGHRHPRLAVGAALPGLPRVHPDPHVRRPHALRPGRSGYGRDPGGPGAGARGHRGPARAAAEPGVVVDAAAGDDPDPTTPPTTEPPVDSTTTSSPPTTTIFWPFPDSGGPGF